MQDSSMPRISEISADLAERFSIEPTWVAGVVKALRMDGLLQSGPRGVNALPASSLDVARILLALMLRVKQHEAPEAVRLFGAFRCLEGKPSIAGRGTETFEQAIAVALDWAGGRPFDGTPDADAYFDSCGCSIAILRDAAVGSVTLSRLAVDDAEMEMADEEGVMEEITHRFCHPTYHRLQAGDLSLETSAYEDFRRYRSGFHEVPTLIREDLFALGQIIAGHHSLGWSVEQFYRASD